MLCAVPLLRALRTMYPKAYISLVTSPVNYEIMRYHPYLNEVLNYDKISFFKTLMGYWRFYRNIRSKHYDLAIVPATVSLSITSSMIALLSGAPQRIGPGRLQGKENPASACFTTPVELDWRDEPRRHQSLRNLDLLKPFEISTGDLSCVIGLIAEERKQAGAFLDSLRKNYKILIGLHPGAGKVENRWPAQHFASIANQMYNNFNAGVIVTAGPMDGVPLAVMRQHLQCPYIVIDRQPLRQVAAIIDQLDLFITNDTGIMHVAGATRANVLALFGPTDPLQWAPIGAKNRYVSAKDRDLNNLSEDEVSQVIEVILSKVNSEHT